MSELQLRGDGRGRAVVYLGELREQICTPMLTTALRDMQWRLRRFIIAAIGTGMVFALTLIITGLTRGFRVEAQCGRLAGH